MRIMILSTLAAMTLIGCGGQKQAVRWNSGRTNELSQYIASRGEPKVTMEDAELDRYEYDLNQLGALNDGAKQAELNHLRAVLGEVRKLKRTQALNVGRAIADHKSLVNEVITQAQMSDAPNLKNTESIVKAVLHLQAQNDALRGLPGATEADRRSLDEEAMKLTLYRQALIAHAQRLIDEAKMAKQNEPKGFTI